jgi:tetratricopeptide (TPR) repeat protein
LGKPGPALEGYDRAAHLLAKLVKAHPRMPAYQQVLAITHSNRGVLRGGQGKHAEALREHQRAADLQAELVKAHPGVPEYQDALARTHYNRGVVLADLGKVEEALDAYGQAHGLQRQIVKAHPGVPGYVGTLARIRLKRAMLLAQEGRYRDSLADLDRGLALVEELHRLDPRNPRVPAALPAALNGRALVLTRLGRQRDADADWDRLLALVPAGVQSQLRQQRTVSGAIGRALAGDHRGAAAAVEALARAPSLSGSDFYDLACVFALSASAAARDAALTPAQRAGEAAGHLCRAFALLERARRDGYFGDPSRRAYLDRDEDLAFLRGRDEHRAFVKSLAPKK